MNRKNKEGSVGRWKTQIEFFEAATKTVFINLLPLYFVLGGVLLYSSLKILGLHELFPVVLSSSSLMVAAFSVATLFVLVLSVFLLMPAYFAWLGWLMFPRVGESPPYVKRAKWLAYLDSYEYIVAAVFTILVMTLLLVIPADISDVLLYYVIGFVFVIALVAGYVRHISVSTKPSVPRIIDAIPHAVLYSISVFVVSLLAVTFIVLGYDSTLKSLVFTSLIAIFVAIINQSLANRYCPYPRERIGTDENSRSVLTDIAIVIVIAIGLLTFSQLAPRWLSKVIKIIGLTSDKVELRFVPTADYPITPIQAAGFQVNEADGGFYSVEVRRYFSFADLEVLCPPSIKENDHGKRCLVAGAHSKMLRIIELPATNNEMEIGKKQ